MKVFQELADETFRDLLRNTGGRQIWSASVHCLWAEAVFTL